MKHQDVKLKKIESTPHISSIEEAIEDLRQGKMVIVIDDPDRENEGDFVIAAEHCTPEAINFMAVHGRGLICLPLEPKRLAELQLPLMVPGNVGNEHTGFTVSIDLKKGCTTGISAHDRSATVLAALDPETKPEDFHRPGHIFPLMAKEGGVLVRSGQTEASVDLARLAGCYPAGVICEIMNEDGTMARLPELIEVAKKWDMKIITVEDLVEYRLAKESLVEEQAHADMPLPAGDFKIHAFKSRISEEHHIALVYGKWEEDEPVLVRVHSSCLTGEVFGSLRCDCGPQLHEAMDMIKREGKGVIVYLLQEGRGIGLINKIRAYQLQDEGMDTVEANVHLGFLPDQRNYGIGAQILRHLGVRKMRLMTNNPRKFIGLKGFGLEIAERVPIVISPNEKNARYLSTKKEKLGHVFEAETASNGSTK